MLEKVKVRVLGVGLRAEVRDIVLVFGSEIRCRTGRGLG